MGGFPKTSENKYLSEIEEDGQKRWIYKSILIFVIEINFDICLRNNKQNDINSDNWSKLLPNVAVRKSHLFYVGYASQREHILGENLFIFMHLICV